MVMLWLCARFFSLCWPFCIHAQVCVSVLNNIFPEVGYVWTTAKGMFRVHEESHSWNIIQFIPHTWMQATRGYACCILRQLPHGIWQPQSTMLDREKSESDQGSARLSKGFGVKGRMWLWWRWGWTALVCWPSKEHSQEVKVVLSIKIYKRHIYCASVSVSIPPNLRTKAWQFSLLLFYVEQ